jgi:Mg2+/Co2+ transporter CorB
MGSTFVAYACALLAYLYLIFTNPAYNSNGEFTPVVVAFAFMIGLQICQIFVTPLSSGIDTIFVAAAFDPQVMVSRFVSIRLSEGNANVWQIKEHPELYERMVRTYPHVQQAIHA